MAGHQADDPSILAHEKVHYGRQVLWSPLWVMLYLLFPAFRLREEKLAYAVQLGFYAKGGRYAWGPMDVIYDMANSYGFLFGQMCSEGEAREFVNDQLRKQEGQEI